MYLHSVILNSVPNFDGSGSFDPVLEIYQYGRLIFSTDAVGHDEKVYFVTNPILIFLGNVKG